MITGFHSLIYSDDADADATRAFLRDVLEWPHLDDGGGWLIFKTPPSELGVHPTSPDGQHGPASPGHQLSLMCDDIEATVAELRGKGVEVLGGIEDQGFGLVATIAVPGAATMTVYEPRHGIAHQLEG